MKPPELDETDLQALWRRVASAYGEDIAQDAVLWALQCPDPVKGLAERASGAAAAMYASARRRRKRHQALWARRSGDYQHCPQDKSVPPEQLSRLEAASIAEVLSTRSVRHGRRGQYDLRAATRRAIAQMALEPLRRTGA